MNEKDKDFLNWLYKRIIFMYEDSTKDFVVTLRDLIDSSDYKMDMRYYDGYVAGWNSALSDKPRIPHTVYESIINNK